MLYFIGKTRLLRAPPHCAACEETNTNDNGSLPMDLLCKCDGADANDPFAPIRGSFPLLIVCIAPLLLAFAVGASRTRDCKWRDLMEGWGVGETKGNRRWWSRVEVPNPID